MIILSLFMIINNDSGQKFKRSKILIRMKMLEYVPALFISNLATLLILSADGIVVGNFIGADALASVNIFYPVTLIMGVISAIASYGTATCLSTYIVKNDVEALSYKKSAIKFESDIINSKIWEDFAKETGAKVVRTKDITGFYFDKDYKLNEDIAGWHPNAKAWAELTPEFANKYIKNQTVSP